MKISKITGTSCEIYFKLDTGETVIGNGELLVNGFVVYDSSLKFKSMNVSLTTEQTAELKRMVRSYKPKGSFRMEFIKE